MRWFFFGSLQDPDVLAIVLGHRLPPERLQAATLADHRRVIVARESYPALQPAQGGLVNGVVVEGLTEEDSSRIRFFEGEEFGLESRQVQLADGRSVDAMAFIAGQSLPLGEGEWSLATWRAEEKADFLPLAEEWMASYGKASFQEADQIWKAGLDRIERQRAKE